MPSHLKALIVLVFGVLWGCLALAKNEPPVRFVRPPAIVSDREIVTFQIQVEPDPVNRLLVVAASDGDLVVRRSDEELNGDKAARTRWLRWRLPVGEFQMAAIVYGAEGPRGRAVHPITVYGFEGYR